MHIAARSLRSGGCLCSMTSALTACEMHNGLSAAARLERLCAVTKATTTLGM